MLIIHNNKSFERLHSNLFLHCKVLRALLLLRKLVLVQFMALKRHLKAYKMIVMTFVFKCACVVSAFWIYMCNVTCIYVCVIWLIIFCAVFFGTSEGVVKFTFKFKGILRTHKHHKNKIRDLVRSNLEKE